MMTKVESVCVGVSGLRRLGGIIKGVSTKHDIGVEAYTLAKSLEIDYDE